MKVNTVILSFWAQVWGMGPTVTAHVCVASVSMSAETRKMANYTWVG
jgi:hypothetical protein